MALLRRARDWRRLAVLLAAVGLSLCAGCALLDLWRGPGPGLAFSHALHVGEEELACLMCHENFMVSDAPGMPVLDTCLTCHDEIDETKPPQKHVTRLFVGEVFQAAAISSLSDEIVFAHARHVSAVEDCGACHTDIEANARLGVQQAVGMDDCMSCHGRVGVANDCGTCHAEVDEGWAPRSHEHNWKRFHGAAFRAREGGMANRCSLCHEDSSCAACHAVEPPENHSRNWRLRAHGFAARLDRRTCAACHQTFDCDRCHAQTQPLSHSGLWGGARNVHCLGCHLPVQSNACVTCHKDAGGALHVFGPPKPAWHNPAMNCRQCHISGAGLLDHVDNGDNCNLCHM